MKDLMVRVGGEQMKINSSSYLNPIGIAVFGGGFFLPLGDGGPDGGI